MSQIRRGKSILAHIRTREFGYNTQFAANIYVLTNRADDVEAINLTLLPGMPFDLRIAKAATAARSRALFAFRGVSLDGAEQVTLEYAWRRCSPADGITGIDLGAVLPDGSIRVFQKLDLKKEPPSEVEAATATFAIDAAPPEDAIVIALADLARAESAAEMLELSLRQGGALIGDISRIFEDPDAAGAKGGGFDSGEKIALQPNLQPPTTRFRALNSLLDAVVPAEAEAEDEANAAHDWRKLIAHAVQLRDSLDGLAHYAERLAAAPQGFGGSADGEVAKMIALQEEWLREQDEGRQAHAAELDRVRAALDQALLDLAKAKGVRN